MKVKLFIAAIAASLVITGAHAQHSKQYFKKIQENRKWGLKGFGSAGKVILPCEYDRMDNFVNGYAILGKGGKYGMIDSNAKFVVPLKYTEIRSFHNGLALVRDENEKYGFMNPEGKLVFEPKFDKAEEFVDRETGQDLPTSLVMMNGKYGLISSDGKAIIEPELDEINPFSEGKALAKKDGKYGYIGTDGQWVVPAKFAKLRPFKQGKALASDSSKWGIIDAKGNYLLEPKYDSIGDYIEGMAAIQQNGLWGFANASGQLAVKPQFTEVRDFHEGFAAVKFLDKTFKDKVAPSFKDLISKSQASTAGWGFVDKIGTFVTGPYFDEVHDFKNGIAIGTLKGGTAGYVNRRGEFKKN